MGETVTSQFRVTDLLTNELILKDIKRGFTVVVQKEEWRYDDEMWRRIRELSEGDMHKFVLESQNEGNTIWSIKQISEIS